MRTNKEKPLNKRKTETTRSPWSQSGWLVWPCGCVWWKRF